MTQRAFPVAMLGLGSFLAAAPLTPLLASPPEPLNKESWIKPDDYPSRAARDEREGTVRFSVRVSPNGRVEDCSIVSSSGYDDLDETTCKLVARRARFKPALDEGGNEVVSYYSNSVRWTLGGDESSERPQSADANQYSNESQRGGDPQSFALPQASQEAEGQPNPLNEAPTYQQAEAPEQPEQLATEQEPDSAAENPDEEVAPSHNDGEKTPWLKYAIFASPVALYLWYLSYKSSRKCPACGQNWGLKKLSSFDEPKSTFQNRSKQSGGSDYIDVKTYESGLRTEVFQCKHCDHEVTRRGSYKKQIDSHSERYR